MLLVEDQGPGIAADELPHVFDRFWRGREQQRQGTGLGLAIAAAIVGRHGGLIVATNRHEGGASFRVTLPTLEAPGSRGPRRGAPQDPDTDMRLGR